MSKPLIYMQKHTENQSNKKELTGHEGILNHEQIKEAYRHNRLTFKDEVCEVQWKFKNTTQEDICDLVRNEKLKFSSYIFGGKSLLENSIMVNGKYYCVEGTTIPYTVEYRCSDYDFSITASISYSKKLRSSAIEVSAEEFKKIKEQAAIEAKIRLEQEAEKEKVQRRLQPFIGGC